MLKYNIWVAAKIALEILEYAVCRAIAKWHPNWLFIKYHFEYRARCKGYLTNESFIFSVLVV